MADRIRLSTVNDPCQPSWGHGQLSSVPIVRSAVTVVVVVALLAGCGGSPTTTEPTNYLEEYGGSAAVYDRIAALTDCDELQGEFNVAAENNDLAEPGTPNHRQTLGYMTAAEDRRQELGC